MDTMKAVLGFEDGDFVVGEGFGVKGECAGELVFNTQMTVTWSLSPIRVISDRS